MINVESSNSQIALKPSKFSFCSLRFQINQEYENLEILHYPNAPDTSILCSPHDCSIKQSYKGSSSLFLPKKTLKICLIQCYSKEGNRIPFLFRFAIEDFGINIIILRMTVQKQLLIMKLKLQNMHQFSLLVGQKIMDLKEFAFHL